MKWTYSLSYQLGESLPFKQYNLEESQNYTFNLFKEISQNNIPTIIDAIDSPLILQQGFFCALVEYFNNLNKANNEILIDID